METHMALTKEQKERIVAALMGQAGNIAEFWEERSYDLADVPQKEGIDYLASLMRKMPGKYWDVRLGRG